MRSLGATRAPPPEEPFHFVMFMKAFGFFDGRCFQMVTKASCVGIRKLGRNCSRYLTTKHSGASSASSFSTIKSHDFKNIFFSVSTLDDFHANNINPGFFSGFIARFPDSFQDGDKGDKDFQSSESSATTKESATNVIPDGKKLGRSGRFCLQFPILLHQKLGGKQFK